MPKLKVNIVNSFPQEKFFSVEVPFSNYIDKTTCLYVPIPREANLATIDPTLYHLPLIARSPEIILFRFHRPDLIRLEKENHLMQIKLVAKRLNKAAIYFLIWDGHLESYELVYQTFSGSEDRISDKELFIKEIRHAELYSIINQPNTLLNEDESYHYIFSNGNHYRKFLRVGNALYSKDVLDSFCFWLLPYTKSKPLILLDSNSIISLGLNLVHYCHDCGETVDTKWFGSVECLLNYFEDDTDILIKLTKKLRSQDAPTTILNIFSAKGTGRLCQRIKNLCNDASLSIVKNVILFSVEGNQIELDEEVFCYLDEDFRGIPPGTPCPLCAANSVGITIDDKTYTLDLPAAAKPASLNIKSIRPTASFFSKYYGSDCFTVHKDQHDRSRHHMIHIDIIQLLKNNIFSERVINKAREFGKDVDVILIPEHNAAAELGQLVKKVINVPLIQADHNKLKDLNGEDKTILTQSRNILLIDDVVISGTRLQEYKEFLDRTGIKTPETTIKLFVGLARPESEDHLEGIKDYLYPHSNFECVEKLLLPNWSEEFCPWCWEANRLSNTDGKVISEPLILSRYEQLLDKTTGISENLFLQWDATRQLKHGARKTFFGPMEREIEIFVAIASVIQTMRSNKLLHEVDSQSKPVAKVYDVDKYYDVNKYLKGRFFEDFIRACILRASVRSDIRSSKIEKKLKEKISDLIHKEKHSEPLIPELILNIVQEKLPLVNIDPKILEGKNPGVSSFLKFLLNSKK